MSSRRSKSGSRAARAAKSNTRSARGRGRAQSGSTGSAARSQRGRRAGAAASHAVKLLKQDHREVERAFAQFASAAAQEEKQQIAARICKMLTVHAQIEEELLYPAAREALDPDDAHLVAEARVEHSTLKDLIAQIEDVDQPDEQYEAKVSVLGEYVQHHVKEEEGDLFPRLERTSLDLQALGERLQERKAALMGEPRSGERPQRMSGPGAPAPGTVSGTALGGGRTNRSAAQPHARRR